MLLYILKTMDTDPNLSLHCQKHSLQCVLSVNDEKASCSSVCT